MPKKLISLAKMQTYDCGLVRFTIYLDKKDMRADVFYRYTGPGYFTDGKSITKSYPFNMEKIKNTIAFLKITGYDIHYYLNVQTLVYLDSPRWGDDFIKFREMIFFEILEAAAIKAGML